MKDVSMALCPNKETEGGYFQQKGSKWCSGKKDYKWGLVMLTVNCCAIQGSVSVEWGNIGD